MFFVTKTTFLCDISYCKPKKETEFQQGEEDRQSPEPAKEQPRQSLGLIQV